MNRNWAIGFAVIAIFMVTQILACGNYIVHRAATQQVAKDATVGVLVMPQGPDNWLLKNQMGAVFEQALMNTGMKVKSLRHYDVLYSEMANVSVFDNTTSPNPYIGAQNQGAVREIGKEIIGAMTKEGQVGYATLKEQYGIDYLFVFYGYGYGELLLNVVNLNDYTIAYSYYVNGADKWKERCETMTYDPKALESLRKTNNEKFWCSVCTTYMILDDMKIDVVK